MLAPTVPIGVQVDLFVDLQSLNLEVSLGGRNEPVFSLGHFLCVYPLHVPDLVPQSNLTVTVPPAAEVE